MSIFTPKFELQIETKSGSFIVCGVNSINEAKKEILEIMQNQYLKKSYKATGKFYLWGNSKAGKSYLDSVWADYYCYYYNNGSINKERCGIEIKY